MVFNATTATDKHAMQLSTARVMRTAVSPPNVTAALFALLHWIVYFTVKLNPFYSILLVIVEDEKTPLKGCASRLLCSQASAVHVKMVLGDKFSCCEGDFCNIDDVSSEEYQ